MVATGAFVLAACSSSGGGSVEAFCAAIEEFATTLEEDDPFEADPADVDATLDQAESDVRAAADAAPDAISADMDIVADAFGELVDVFRSLEDLSDPSATAEAIDAADFVDEEFLDASEAVNEYAFEECGVDLE